MALPATDAFTASNGTLLTTYSASWTQLQGSNDIIANGCCPNQTGDNIAYWNADAFSGDHYAECTVADLFSSSSGAGGGVSVRVQSGAATCYGWEANTTFSRIVKLVAGTKTTLDDTLAIPSIGARVRLEATGTGPVTLSVYYDDVLAGSVEDSTDVITGGSAGVIGFGNSGTARIDDWEADNLGGGGAVELVVDSATHAHAAESPVLTQANLLVVQGAQHNQAADSIVLSVAATLAPNDASHGHAAESPSLTQANVLAVNASAHGHTADSVVLSLSQLLQVADALHSHAVDNVVLTQAHVLAVADALHAHSAANVVLEQHSMLAVQDAAHGHTADSVALSVEDILAVADSIHAHTADEITLTQSHVLVVSDALHQHLADAISLQLPGYVPPPGRVHTVEPARRVFVVETPNRTYVVAKGNRTFQA